MPINRALMSSSGRLISCGEIFSAKAKREQRAVQGIHRGQGAKGEKMHYGGGQVGRVHRVARDVEDRFVLDQVHDSHSPGGVGSGLRNAAKGGAAAGGDARDGVLG